MVVEMILCCVGSGPLMWLPLIICSVTESRKLIVGAVVSFAAPVFALGKYIVIFVTMISAVVVLVIVCTVTVPVFVVSAVGIAVPIITIIIIISMIYVEALSLDVSVVVVSVPVVIVTKVLVPLVIVTKVSVPVVMSSVPESEFVVKVVICSKYWGQRPVNGASGVNCSS